MADPWNFAGVQKFRIENPPSQVQIRIGVNTAAPAQYLEVRSHSGVQIASMDVDGVITSHVDDPVKALDEMLAGDLARHPYACAQLRSYLLLFKAYFSLPQANDWRKNPLL